jgi:hypothetical protein
MIKHQIPSAKPQTMTKAPMTETRGLGDLGVGYCDLFGIWDLEIEI